MYFQNVFLKKLSHTFACYFTSLQVQKNIIIIFFKQIIYPPDLNLDLSSNNTKKYWISDSPYRTAISGAILKLQEEGKLHILKTRWWKEKREGGSCRVSRRVSRSTPSKLKKRASIRLFLVARTRAFDLQDESSKSSSAANELGLANVGGVFVVLMGGMGVACVIAVCEFVWKSRKVAVEERVSKILQDT